MYQGRKFLSIFGGNRFSSSTRDRRSRFVHETEEFLSRMLVYEQEFKTRKSLDVNKLVKVFFESLRRRNGQSKTIRRNLNS